MYWYLHYAFGLHHINIKVDWIELQKILSDLSFEFVIHQEFDNNGKRVLFWLEDYCGEKFCIASKKND